MTIWFVARIGAKKNIEKIIKIETTALTSYGVYMKLVVRLTVMKKKTIITGLEKEARITNINMYGS